MAWSLDSVMFLIEELQPASKVPRHPNITRYFIHRFTGKESKCFSWNFGHVTETLLQMKPDRNTAFKLHALHKAAEKLRDSIQGWI